MCAAPYGNTFALGAGGGRPPMYETPDEMAEKMIEYLDYIKGERGAAIDKNGDVEDWIRPPEPITITGLCLYLGFESRQSFYDYEKKQEFAYFIKKMRLLVENRYEKALGSKEVVGAIFALKNMGWVDKVERGFTDKDGKDISTPGQIVIIQPADDEDDPLEIKSQED